MDSSSEFPRQKLKEIVERGGEAILQDPDRCEGLLKDHCGSYRREIAALVGAMDERVPLELKSSWQTAMTPEAMRARLVQRLQDHRGLAPEVADWAVEAWAHALGIGLGRKSDPAGSLLAGSGGASMADAALIGAAASSAGFAPPSSSQQSVQEKVLSDRAGGSARVSSELEPGAAKQGAIAGMLATPQKKAGAGVIALIACAALLYAIMPHPKPVPPPDNPDTSVVQPPSSPGPGPGIQHTAAPAPQAVLPAGTPILVRLSQGVNSDQVQIGQTLDATIAAPLTFQGNVIIPQGSTAVVKVTSVDQAGKLHGRAHLVLELVQVTSGSKRFDVASYKDVEGPQQTVKAAQRAGVAGAVGAGVGAVVGHIFGHAGKGAAAGGVAGGAVGVATAKPAPVKIEAEKVITFSLTRPLHLKG